MISGILFLSGLLMLILLGCFSSKLPVIDIHTDLGNISVEVDTLRAPVTAKNFLRLVKNGVYEQAFFYRVVRMDNQPDSKVKIEVIQGGLFDDEKINRFTPILHENTRETGITHTDGVISMARYTPGTASTEFFICIGDQPDLDYQGNRNSDGQGFAAFGYVIKGMDVVRKIHQLNDSAQYLKRFLPIIQIEIKR